MGAPSKCPACGGGLDERPGAATENKVSLRCTKCGLYCGWILYSVKGKIISSSSHKPQKSPKWS